MGGKSDFFLLFLLWAPGNNHMHIAIEDINIIHVVICILIIATVTIPSYSILIVVCILVVLEKDIIRYQEVMVSYCVHNGYIHV